MPRIRKPLGSVPANVAANASNASDAPENIPAKSSKKRKSTDTEGAENKPAPENSKKARVDSETSPEPSATPPTKSSKKKPAPAPPEIRPEDDILDVSCIVDTHPDEPFEVFDTCDTIRRKIRALLANPKYPKITQAAFCRAIVKAAYGENSDKTIQAASLGAFLKKKGPLAGNTSAVYYAAYVFFEKLRIKQGKPKSNDREIMEELWWDGGVDTKKPASSVRFVISSAARGVAMDKYGKPRVVY
ncbi:hypothetical protein QBC37DRAFT_374258 [Rhypophila decipiens]|uniref:DUF7726 domain-containing protein n=1 Tax=Rhypophila decipiens TaxID=261697 RepID=A0AAN7B9M8_9PEZI|nr:hypothetical protein QBC37DRAFT_374258 [Rhypophila decipiens]